MERPRITLHPTPFDLALEVLGVLALLTLVALPVLYWGRLPETIPTHFDAAGRPDSYGGKESLLVLPILGIALYLMLSFIQRLPHTFNYPVEITPANAERLYRHAVRMMRLMKVVIGLAFAYILHRIIHIALGQAQGLGGWFLPVFLSTMAILVGYGLWPAFRRQDT